MKPNLMENAKAIILSRSMPEPNSGCWLWITGVNKRGYGVLTICQKQHGAHRVSYQAFKGQIPDGLVVMHKCDTPSCVNPDHLSTGTVLDNNKDAASKRRFPNQKKTHCSKGHPFSGENLYQYRGYRMCKACLNAGSLKAHRKSALSRKNPFPVQSPMGLTESRPAHNGASAS